MILRIIRQAKEAVSITGHRPSETPLEPDAGKTRSVEACQGGLRPAAHVLLVFNELKTLDTVKKMLLGLGHRVTEFSNPDHAVKYFNLYNDQFDLIIGDGEMFESNPLAGRMEEVREDIPVLLCAEQDVPRTDKNPHTVKMVITKPVEFEVLKKAVEKLLWKRRERT